MSFVGIRTFSTSPFSRQFQFLRFLLEIGMSVDFESSSDKMTEVRHVLSEFHLGLLNYPYRDEGQNGSTVIFKFPDPDEHSFVERYAPRDLGELDEKERFCVFSTTSTLMDFFNDYFGLDSSEPMSFRSIRKKYRSAFAFGSLDLSNISDFATLAMRAARDIFKHRDLFDTTDGRFIYTRIGYTWNRTETIIIKNGMETTVLDAYF